MEDEASRLGLAFALGVKGLGGVLSIRLKTSSSLGALVMTGTPFTGARLKIERAYRHIAEIERIVDSFLRSDTNKIVVNHDPIANITEVVGQSRELLPREVSLAFGDAVHNVRTALDHTMGAVIRVLAPGSNADHIYFPIHAELHNVVDALTNAKEGSPVAVAMATERGKLVAKAIIDKIQPTKAGNGKLIWAVNRLDNIDKHRLLLTVTSLLGVRFSGTIGRNRLTDATMLSYASHNSKIIIAQGMPVEGNFQPIFQVLIDETEAAKGEPLVPTLKNMAKVCIQAIETVEANFA